MSDPTDRCGEGMWRAFVRRSWRDSTSRHGGQEHGGGTEALIADVKYRAMFSAASACSLGVGMFTLAPVMCAAAPNLPMLIAGRALQSMEPRCPTFRMVWQRKISHRPQREEIPPVTNMTHGLSINDRAARSRAEPQARDERASPFERLHSCQLHVFTPVAACKS
jgi:hypothetical protein